MADGIPEISCSRRKAWSSLTLCLALPRLHVIKICSLSQGTDTQKELAVSALEKNFHQKAYGGRFDPALGLQGLKLCPVDVLMSCNSNGIVHRYIDNLYDTNKRRVASFLHGAGIN